MLKTPNGVETASERKEVVQSATKAVPTSVGDGHEEHRTKRVC